MKSWLIKWWKEVTIVILAITFLISLAILISSNSNIRGREKEAKFQIKALHKLNEDLEKEIQLNKDSIKIFHDLAVFHNNKDTVYLKQIKYLQTKTNEEITQINKLSTDSQYIIFSNLLSEYSKTRFSQDSL